MIMLRLLRSVPKIHVAFGLVLHDDSRGHSRESGNPEKDQAESDTEILILRTLLIQIGLTQASFERLGF